MPSQPRPFTTAKPFKIKTHLCKKSKPTLRNHVTQLKNMKKTEKTPRKTRPYHSQTLFPKSRLSFYGTELKNGEKGSLKNLNSSQNPQFFTNHIRC